MAEEEEKDPMAGIPAPSAMLPRAPKAAAHGLRSPQSFAEHVASLEEMKETGKRLQEVSSAGQRLAQAANAKIHAADLAGARADLEEASKLPTPREVIGERLWQDRVARLRLCQGNHVSWFIQGHISCLSLLSFFERGVFTPEVPDRCRIGIDDQDDERYLMGLLDAMRELERYGVNRGQHLDLDSLRLCLGISQCLEQALMQFDFRNSDIRRRFDGVKYSVRKFETFVYEVDLAIKRASQLQLATEVQAAAATATAIATAAEGDDSASASEAPPANAAPAAGAAKEAQTDLRRWMKPGLPPELRTSEPAPEQVGQASEVAPDSAKAASPAVEPQAGPQLALDLQVFSQIKKRYDHFDACRELVLKRARDVVKNAKNAIYALHRSDFRKADADLRQCAKDVNTLHTDVVADLPSLRGGIFSGGLEEMCEALAYRVFQKDRRLLSKAEMQAASGLTCDIALHEYLGGLMDLTGEIGRFAVRSCCKGRNALPEVELCRACCVTVHSWCQELPHLPMGLGKKMGGLKSTIGKIENALYELALLSQAGLRVHAPAFAAEDDAEGGDRGADEPHDASWA